MSDECSMQIDVVWYEWVRSESVLWLVVCVCVQVCVWNYWVCSWLVVCVEFISLEWCSPLSFSQWNHMKLMFTENCLSVYLFAFTSGVPSDHTTVPSTSQTSTHIPSEQSSQSFEPTTSTTPTHPQTDSSIVTSEFNDCFALGDVYLSICCMHVCWVFCFVRWKSVARTLVPLIYWWSCEHECIAHQLCVHFKCVSGMRSRRWVSECVYVCVCVGLCVIAWL